ncbi:DUF5666 domain-containing protein [Rhodohalobacter mucosus]|uniref:DUF5666 domain-containing protein n=1 Tax=Rhodohalobacter mucosus TaxID=2079485 RepID=A0A316TV25_9BACT|nr:DUF5666 domain-containing protein [Rhodohalobacter mucosus]PWN06204.1 hypothetical protein DDZ15_10235 [Rhodohalobacter mucosus]
MMQSTKIRFNSFIFPLLLASAAILLHACTIDNLNNGALPVNENEFRIAGQIIGESVSESENGVLSNFTEAFAVPDAEGLRQGPSILSLRSETNLQNYSYSYDPVTGKHNVGYVKEEVIGSQQVSSDVSLTYTFRNSQGNLIENPVENFSSIESVEFLSSKSGSIETTDKLSVFSRVDRFFIDGISGASPNLLIDGIHSGEGFFSIIQPDGSRLEREYILDMNFLNVSINKENVEANRNFRSGVTGALSYESTIRENGSASEGTKIVNGTLEFAGDGTALLKFRNFFDVFRVRLDKGTVFDDDEFEGRIAEVNLTQNIFVLANGQRIRLTAETLIEDDGDYFSLQEVAAALSENNRVKAEGDYIRDQESENLWTASEVEFEDDSNEFEEAILSVNLNDNAFTVQSGDTYYLTETSEIDDDSDFLSLQEVQNAIEDSLPVFADGKFVVETTTGRLIVEEVEFTYNVQEIDEPVVSVDGTDNTFTVLSGKTIKITDETVINPDKIATLQDVETALSQGINVEAAATIYFDSSNNLWIALQVEFDESDDDDDDEGEGEGDD